LKAPHTTQNIHSSTAMHYFNNLPTVNTSVVYIISVVINEDLPSLLPKLIHKTSITTFCRVLIHPQVMTSAGSWPATTQWKSMGCL